jgi:predicted nucleic acid-binding protein
VKVLYDTSALFAALVPTHPQHAACFTHLQTVQSGENQAYLSTHSVAELYSVMTRYPVQPRITPAEAHCLITDVLHYVGVVPLTLEHYQAAIAQMVQLQVPGGAIFDALIAQAAIIVQANTLITLNPRHFTRLGEEVSRLVQVPA